jgi:hypothetical protein
MARTTSSSSSVVNGGAGSLDSVCSFLTGNPSKNVHTLSVNTRKTDKSGIPLTKIFSAKEPVVPLEKDVPKISTLFANRIECESVLNLFTPLNKRLKLRFMSLRKFVPLLLAASVVSITGATAQTANADFRITKVTPDFQDTPTFSGPTFNKRVGRAQKWLEVETDFDWQPRLKDPRYLDELTASYYILLNNAAYTQDHQPTLLVGTVTHVDVMQGRDLHSSIYINPRTLDKFFGGNIPGNVTASFIDIGVTLSKQGQVVAEYTLKGKGAWWTSPQYKQTQGAVLNKSETPFASVSWDYFEPIKAKSSSN